MHRARRSRSEGRQPPPVRSPQRAIGGCGENGPRGEGSAAACVSANLEAFWRYRRSRHSKIGRSRRRFMAIDRLSRRDFTRLLALGGAAPLLPSSIDWARVAEPIAAPAVIDEKFWQSVRDRFVMPPDLAVLNA